MGWEPLLHGRRRQTDSARVSNRENQTRISGAIGEVQDHIAERAKQDSVELRTQAVAVSLCELSCDQRQDSSIGDGFARLPFGSELDRFMPSIRMCSHDRDHPPQLR
jgi:hypothetical protein